MTRETMIAMLANALQDEQDSADHFMSSGCPECMTEYPDGTGSMPDEHDCPISTELHEVAQNSREMALTRYREWASAPDAPCAAKITRLVGEA